MSDDIGALVASIEGGGFIVTQSKKTKKKNKAKGKAKPFVDESTPDVASSDDEDPMVRMVQAKQKAANDRKPGPSKPSSILPAGPAHILASLKAAEAGGGAPPPPPGSTKITKAEAKLALLQREYDAFSGSHMQEGLSDADRYPPPIFLRAFVPKAHKTHHFVDVFARSGPLLSVSIYLSLYICISVSLSLCLSLSLLGAGGRMQLRARCLRVRAFHQARGSAAHRQPRRRQASCQSQNP
jgi:hypothetical protein